MAEIDAETLIMSMKRRPALYNRNDPNYYSHKKYKAKLWIEVCKEVFPHFDSLKPQNKVEYGHELQRRWKSLRTCFTRELNMQKKEKLKKERNEGPMKKRKRYEYFDAMSFLLSSDNGEEEQDQEVTRESDDSHESGDPLENVKNETMMYHSGNAGNNSHSFEVEADTGLLRPIYENRNESLEDKILDMLKEIKKDEEDEDRQFMLSLVPSFRKLNAKQKFEARIEILRVLKDVTFRESGGS
ncbi:unnamed protein product [Arctia plantaginis]|uniref:MADF domain-containing protein n=1 Tax=Arctia plantaginis TaxID=874455 RepID=A0A8S0ZDI3_ARCPL|nr:unnamed protein product [Arctia plantaginis]